VTPELNSKFVICERLRLQTLQMTNLQKHVDCQGAGPRNDPKPGRGPTRAGGAGQWRHGGDDN